MRTHRSNRQGTKRFRNLLSSSALAVGLVVVPAGAAVVASAATAMASESYNNASIATHALGYKNQNYGQECWGFVRDMVYWASGGTQDITAAAGGADYFAHLNNAGGTQITNENTLAEGDVVQEGQYGGHTFIIVSHVSGDTFWVVDSNHDPNQPDVVLEYERTFTLGSDEEAFRFGTTQSGGAIAGSLDGIHRVPGGIAASGWAIDKDTSQPIYADTYAGNGSPNSSVNPGTRVLANSYRPDVGAAYPGYGDYHGFSAVVSDNTAGAQTVCTYGINYAGTPGGNVKLGCKTITVSNIPFGSFDTVTPVQGGVDVTGWSIDPDTDASIYVDVYGGNGAPGQGNPGERLTANTSRPDVASAYPGYSSSHGFSAFFPLPSGAQTVCTYGINYAGTPGGNVKLGCKSVTVP